MRKAIVFEDVYKGNYAASGAGAGFHGHLGEMTMLPPPEILFGDWEWREKLD